MYDAHASGFKFKAAQISDFTWLSDKNRKWCINRMQRLDISSLARFECLLENRSYLAAYGKFIVGLADCIDDDKLYEFKCVQSLSDVHYMQLLVYMWLDRKAGHVREAYLYNNF